MYSTQKKNKTPKNRFESLHRLETYNEQSQPRAFIIHPTQHTSPPIPPH